MLSHNSLGSYNRRELMSGAGAIALLLGTSLAACSKKTEMLGTVQQLDLSAMGAIAALKAGTITAEGYVKTLIVRAKEMAGLNAIIAINEEGAIASAKAIDAKKARGETLPLLAGLPLLVKDNIDTAELPTTAATPALKDFRPKANAPTLQKLIDNGAIVLAKTNMHELAFGITSTNPVTGFVKNPYDQARIAGGSSGGTAVGLAAHIAPAGLGTDTGGSARIPSALCGTAGMRPSVGNGGDQRRYNGSGVVPISHTRDTIGAMARTVADIALLDSVIMGTAMPVAADLKGLRIGLPHAYFWENLDSELSAIADKKIAKLKEAGVIFVDGDLAGISDLNNNISFPVALYEANIDLPAYLLAEGSSITIDEIVALVQSPDVKGAYGVAKTFPKEAYDAAISVYRPQLQALYANYFAANSIDAMLYPTTPIPAVLIDDQFSGAVSINGVAQPGGLNAEFGAYIHNVDPSSNAGIPGISFPAGLTSAGLPIGFEVDGPFGSDARLLSIAMALEAVLGGIAPPK